MTQKTDIVMELLDQALSVLLKTHANETQKVLARNLD